MINLSPPLAPPLKVVPLLLPPVGPDCKVLNQQQVQARCQQLRAAGDPAEADLLARIWHAATGVRLEGL